MCPRIKEQGGRFIEMSSSCFYVTGIHCTLDNHTCLTILLFIPKSRSLMCCQVCVPGSSFILRRTNVRLFYDELWTHRSVSMLRGALDTPRLGYVRTRSDINSPNEGKYRKSDWRIALIRMKERKPLWTRYRGDLAPVCFGLVCVCSTLSAA